MFDYTARVDQDGGFFPAGTMITGRFSYDDSLSPISSFSGTNTDTAVYQSPILSLSASFNGLTFSGGGFASVTDASGGDEEDGFNIGSYGGPVFLSLSVWDPGNSWLSNTGLPTYFPSPLWQGPFVDPNDDDDLTVPHGEFSFFNGNDQSRFDAVILSVSAVSGVPEPATWAMMIIGFGAIGATMRRQGANRMVRALG